MRTSNKPVPSVRRWSLGVIRLLSLLAVAASAATAGAQGWPVIESAGPAAVRQGDVITLTGDGFHLRPQDYRIFIGGDGAATWAGVRASTSTMLHAEVGAVPATGVDTLTLWTGQEIVLPDTVLTVPGRTYLLTDVTWFVADSEASFTPITLIEVSPNTSGGQLVGDGLRVTPPDTPTLPACGPDEGGGFGCTEIEIKVIATSGGGSPPPPPLNGGPERYSSGGSAVTSGGRGVAASFSMVWIAASSAPSPAEFAADMAQAIERALGAVGVTATTDGQQVVISYGGGVSSGSVLVARVPPGGPAA